MKGDHDDDRLFSYRTGIRQKKKIQIGGIDDELHKRIWNTVYRFCLEGTAHHIDDSAGTEFEHITIPQSEIISKIFDSFFKEDASVYHSPHDVKYKFFSLKWDEVYSFVEFVLRNFPLEGLNDFRDEINQVLEEEYAGYRLIGDQITPITNELEMDTVRKAQHTGMAEINRHIESAISLLSDRKEPDPRNAVKEAISAIEALCRKITGDSSATLGQALHQIKIRDTTLFDPHLEDAIKKLYKFSNDSSGVRHSHAEGKTQVGFDEAKFMVVTCSAIVNYLVKYC